MHYHKRLLNHLLIGYGGLMLLLIGLLTANMLLVTNVLYMNSPLVQVLDIVTTVIDIFAFAISTCVVIYGIYLYGAKALKTLYAAYFCITVFHYVAILLIEWAIFPGKIPVEESVLDSILALVLYLLENLFLFVILDCLRLFLVVFVTAKLLNRHRVDQKEFNRKANILGLEQKNSKEGLFPFEKFVSFKNPIQIGAFATAVIYWLTYFIQYVYIDILILIKMDYVEGFGMQIIYLLLNAVLSCICYCIMMYMLMKYDEKMPIEVK